MHQDHFAALTEAKEKKLIPSDLSSVIHNFYLSYAEAIEENGFKIENFHSILNQFLQFVIEQLASPYIFEPFHQRLTTPVNYYQFGLELMRPLVIFEQSKTLGLAHADEIEKLLEKQENVILFANHQTEPDPQAISLLLEKTHPKLAEEMIFVAGQRVISDPLAVPFSKGRNLLCIFSKRYIDTDPNLKAERLLHNKRTMHIMGQLLNEGGKCIYVAPSGGRDRPNEKGEISVSPLDPQSIEMFRLIAKQANKPTHFYPLTLATYQFLPPPNSIEKTLGERRHAHSTPIHLAFGDKLNFDQPALLSIADKKERRNATALYIWTLINDTYKKLNKT